MKLAATGHLPSSQYISLSAYRNTENSGIWHHVCGYFLMFGRPVLPHQPSERSCLNWLPLTVKAPGSFGTTETTHPAT